MAAGDPVILEYADDGGRWVSLSAALKVPGQPEEATILFGRMGRIGFKVATPRGPNWVDAFVGVKADTLRSLGEALIRLSQDDA